MSYYEVIQVDGTTTVVMTEVNVAEVTEVDNPEIQLTEVGIPGPPGPSGTATYRSNISPSGVQDGVNLIFTFPEIPIEPTFELYQNGLLEDPLNYFLLGNTLTLTTPPKSWWRLAASYFV